MLVKVTAKGAGFVLAGYGLLEKDSERDFPDDVASELVALGYVRHITSGKRPRVMVSQDAAKTPED